MKKLTTLVALVASHLAFTCAPAQAQTTGPLKLLSVRPMLGNYALLMADLPAGQLCSTSTYSIDLTTPGGKAMFAVAQAAVLSGTRVQIELWATNPCGTNPINPIGSIYGLPN